MVSLFSYSSYRCIEVLYSYVKNDSATQQPNPQVIYDLVRCLWMCSFCEEEKGHKSLSRNRILASLIIDVVQDARAEKVTRVACALLVVCNCLLHWLYARDYRTSQAMYLLRR